MTSLIHLCQVEEEGSCPLARLLANATHSPPLLALAALAVIKYPPGHPQNDKNAVLIDIRTAKEKDSQGMPDVPGGAASRLVEVEFAYTDDRALRTQLRNPNGVETVVTALQVSSALRQH